MAVTREKMIADVMQALEDSVAFMPEEKREETKRKILNGYYGMIINVPTDNEWLTNIKGY